MKILLHESKALMGVWYQFTLYPLQVNQYKDLSSVKLGYTSALSLISDLFPHIKFYIEDNIENTYFLL